MKAPPWLCQFDTHRLGCVLLMFCMHHHCMWRKSLEIVIYSFSPGKDLLSYAFQPVISIIHSGGVIGHDWVMNSK